VRFATSWIILTLPCGAWPVLWVQSTFANSGLFTVTGNLTIRQLQFANGSQGTITYAANGAIKLLKEPGEVFVGGAVGVDSKTFAN